MDLRRPHEWYPMARALKRRIIYHAGPTNSGKTYHALQVPKLHVITGLVLEASCTKQSGACGVQRHCCARCARAVIRSCDVSSCWKLFPYFSLDTAHDNSQKGSLRFRPLYESYLMPSCAGRRLPGYGTAASTAAVIQHLHHVQGHGR